MKKKQKQNKKKYDNYKHIVPWWKKNGFKSKEDCDRRILWTYESIKEHGFLSIVFKEDWLK